MAEPKRTAMGNAVLPVGRYEKCCPGAFKMDCITRVSAGKPDCLESVVGCWLLVLFARFLVLERGVARSYLEPVMGC